MRKRDYSYLGPLTKREKDVLRGLVTHFGSFEKIADELKISITTVKTHVDNIYSKFYVNNKLGAVIVGVRKGLVSLSIHDADSLEGSRVDAALPSFSK